MTRIPILTYHQISERPDPLYERFTVTPRQFERQMVWLADRGYSTVGLDDVLAYLSSGGVLPPKPIVITFDDGCCEAAENALIVLPRLGFTATFFLVTGMMGATSNWSLVAAKARLPLIDWSAAERLVRAGFSCGSHTVSHRRLTALSLEQCREELVRSQSHIQERLGGDVIHLSYPFGAFNQRVKTVAEATGYLTACRTGGGLTGATDDRMALHRVTVPGDTPFADFAIRVRTGRATAEIVQLRPSRWLPQGVATKLVRIIKGRDRRK